MLPLKRGVNEQQAGLYNCDFVHELPAATAVVFKQQPGQP